MSVNFVPTEELLNEILEFGQIAEPQAADLEKVYSGLENRLEPVDSLLAHALPHVPDVDVARTLIEQIITINQFSSHVGMNVEDFIDSQIREFSKTLDLEGSLADQLSLSLSRLEKLASLQVFQLASKAIELTYDRDNLLQRTRIMTDVRPLFTKDGVEIEGAVVAHTLRISFDSAGSDCEMSLALDDTDLRQLISDCERALIKAETAREKLCEAANIPTIANPGDAHVN
jgi:hypothetical protein